MQRCNSSWVTYTVHPSPWLQAGNVPESEMFRTFNMGVGMVAVVDSASVDAALSAGLSAFVLGEIVEGEGVIMD